MRRMLVVAALALACAPAPSYAQDGCVAVGSHVFIPPQQWQCEYVATGPGRYVAATTNPFIISIERGGDPDRIVLVTRGTGAPTSGRLSTLPGDRVFLSITCWNYTPPGGACAPGANLGGRDGVLAAHSDI